MKIFYQEKTAKNLGIIYDDRTRLQFYLENKDVFPPMYQPKI